MGGRIFLTLTGTRWGLCFFYVARLCWGAKPNAYHLSFSFTQLLFRERSHASSRYCSIVAYFS